jgi:glycosyltransferase involved in cell wall biosynthesis
MGPTPSEAQRREAARIEGLALHHNPAKLEWMDDPWSDVEAAGDWLLSLERETAPDIVHLNGYCHGSLPFRAPVLLTAHSCVLSWWRAVKGGDAPGEWDIYREKVAGGIAAAAEVVAPTHAMLSAVEEHYGGARRQEVIPNGRRWNHRTELRKEPFVFSAGRLWDEAKNVRAVEALAGAISWPVYLAGDGGESGEAQHLGQLSPRSMEWWLDRASIYVLPARYEPFGLSILEAALAGCALVLGDIPSLRENWTGAAEFIAPGDQRALVTAIESLIADPAARICLSNAARERALAFTPERMACSYVSAYQALAA